MKRSVVLLVVFFALSICSGRGQTVQRIFTFEKGDEFKKQTILNSTFVIQRGTQQLDISSSSTVYKTYNLKNVNDDAYTFVVTIPKMDVVIKAVGQELHYDSEKPIDTTSRIETALKYIVGKTSTVLVDRKGEILSDSDPFSTRLANDTLLSFAGIQPELFVKGSQFTLIPDFIAANKALNIGYTWTDTGTVNKQFLKTRFTIDTITTDNTVVKFKSSISGNSINSNTTGTYVLDNRSGVLVQTLLQGISTGYMIYNQTIYAVSRRISLSENVTENGKNAVNLIQDIDYVPPPLASQ